MALQHGLQCVDTGVALVFNVRQQDRDRNFYSFFWHVDLFTLPALKNNQPWGHACDWS
jgi:hypothetical protein